MCTGRDQRTTLGAGPFHLPYLIQGVLVATAHLARTYKKPWGYSCVPLVYHRAWLTSVLGIWTQVPTLAWQALYLSSPLHCVLQNSVSLTYVIYFLTGSNLTQKLLDIEQMVFLEYGSSLQYIQNIYRYAINIMLLILFILTANQMAEKNMSYIMVHLNSQLDEI